MTKIGGTNYTPAYHRNPAGHVNEKKKIETTIKPEDELITESDTGLESGMGDERGRQPGQNYKQQEKPYKPGDIIDEQA